MDQTAADDLARRAEMAERAGQSGDAARLWDALLAAAPTHPKALFIRGRRLMERGDPGGAVAMLAQAEAADTQDPEAPFFAALALNMKGDYVAALAAIDRALTNDPYYFAALLSKGKLLERMNQPRQAALVYRNAVKIAPPPEHLPPHMRKALDDAAQTVARTNAETAEYLHKRTAAARSKYNAGDLLRFDECLDILAGVKRPQVHEPLLLHFPRLPAIPFHDRAHFPWIAQLEAATDLIRGELEVVMREDQPSFAPYIQYPPGSPVNQWTELNHSLLWSTFFLWQDGVRNDANCARCPRTAAVLEGLPLAHQRGFGPTAMFSVLAPNTRIPPHTGSSNARAIVHLPLILPPKCSFRVGNDTRDWRMGEAWVFDDSIDHEAWNGSDQHRVILIFDVWNPLVTAAERDMIENMMLAYNEFNTDTGKYSPR